MSKLYKVWLNVEMCDEEKDKYENLPWPEELFVTGSRAKAFKKMAEILEALNDKEVI